MNLSFIKGWRGMATYIPQIPWEGGMGEQKLKEKKSM